MQPTEQRTRDDAPDLLDQARGHCRGLSRAESTVSLRSLFLNVTMPSAACFPTFSIC